MDWVQKGRTGMSRNARKTIAIYVIIMYDRDTTLTTPSAEGELWKPQLP